jgi:hypothetical protein
MSSVTHVAGRLAATVAAWLVMSVGVAHGADAPREVHGAADAYAEPGIALAWGVLRGADEASTRVTLRIVADPARYPRLAVVGRDPFTQAERVVEAPRPTAGLPDLAIARTHFADFPRTELRFFGPGTADVPVVLVYYLGVPDTTPEFAAAAALDRYLGERIGRARAATGEKR